MAVTPSGTVSSKRHVALSEGWSLLGSHECAPSGSLSAYEPESVGYQPDAQAGRRRQGVLVVVVRHGDGDWGAGTDGTVRGDEQLLLGLLERRPARRRR